MRTDGRFPRENYTSFSQPDRQSKDRQELDRREQELKKEDEYLRRQREFREHRLRIKQELCRISKEIDINKLLQHVKTDVWGMGTIITAEDQDNSDTATAALLYSFSGRVGIPWVSGGGEVYDSGTDLHEAMWRERLFISMDARDLPVEKIGIVVKDEHSYVTLPIPLYLN